MYFSLSPGSIGTANGSALVRLGDTTIVCGVKAEIAEPDLDRPDEGWIGVQRLYFMAVPHAWSPFLRTFHCHLSYAPHEILQVY